MEIEIDNKVLVKLYNVPDKTFYDGYRQAIVQKFDITKDKMYTVQFCDTGMILSIWRKEIKKVIQ